MRKIIFYLAFVITHFIFAQEKESLISQKASEPQTFYISSRTNLSGGKSRVCTYINLPKNTFKWRFNISTNKAEGEQTVTKNLETLSTGISTIDSKTNSLKAISLPNGDSFIQTFIVNKENRDLFLSQNIISDWEIKNPIKDLDYIKESLLDQVKQGSITINENISNNWYLCMRNPNKLYGINAHVQLITYQEKHIANLAKKDPTLLISYNNTNTLNELKKASISSWIQEEYKTAKRTYQEYIKVGGNKTNYKLELIKAIETNSKEKDKRIKRFLKKI